MKLNKVIIALMLFVVIATYGQRKGIMIDDTPSKQDPNMHYDGQKDEIDPQLRKEYIEKTWDEVPAPEKKVDIDAEIKERLDVEAELLLSEAIKAFEKGDWSVADRSKIFENAFGALAIGRVGKSITPQNKALWMIASVYAELNEAELALDYATKCMDITKNGKMPAIEMAYAFEALARANAINDEFDVAERYYKFAKHSSSEIKSSSDRKKFIARLETGNWNNMREDFE
jgi:hypothetical protein